MHQARTVHRPAAKVPSVKGVDWGAVDRLVARAPGPEAIMHHRLGVFAAHGLRQQGRPVPERYQEEERLAALAAMTARPTLERVLAHAGEPLLLVKGPELARHYPPETPKPYRDLDLVALDAPAVQRRLLAAGAEPVRDEPIRPDLHHEAPIVFPGLPMVVEVHRSLKWPDWAAPPPAAGLFERAAPAAGDERLLVLPAADHAVLAAAHAWAHLPLRRILDLLDVAVLLASGPGTKVSATALAHTWGVQRLWGTSLAAVEALFEGAPRPWPLRSWARDLPAARERTAVETALSRWLSPAACRPPAPALRAGGGALRRDLRRR